MSIAIATTIQPHNCSMRKDSSSQIIETIITKKVHAIVTNVFVMLSVNFNTADTAIPEKV